MKNRWRFHDWITDECRLLQGQPWEFKIMGRPEVIVVNSPALVEDVLKTSFANFVKDPYLNGILNDLLGDGIFAVDDVKWIYQRETASNLFTTRALRDSMAASVQTHTQILSRIFEDAAVTRKPFDLFKLLNRSTIEAFAEIGFGIQMGCLDSDKEHPFQRAFDTAQYLTTKRFMPPTWVWKLMRVLGIGWEAPLKRSFKNIDGTVLDIISRSLELCA